MLLDPRFKAVVYEEDRSMGNWLKNLGVEEAQQIPETQRCAGVSSETAAPEVPSRSALWQNLDSLIKQKQHSMTQAEEEVANRNIITTADAERRCVSPSDLQPAIDQIVQGYQDGRAFVRPSGTEDIVRVYAEASTQDAANKLAYEVGVKVYELAGGVGDKPKVPA
ncbi:hypothetical protein ISCGN_001829 [Ixodes scapularis]